MTRDTRTSQRYEVTLEVEFSRGDVRGRGRARNLSIGGMFLETEDRLVAGDRIVVQFRVPGQKEPVEAAAVVRWQDHAGTGLSFEGLRARDVWALGKYFESL